LHMGSHYRETFTKTNGQREALQKVDVVGETKWRLRQGRGEVPETEEL